MKEMEVEFLVFLDCLYIQYMTLFFLVFGMTKHA